MKKVIQFGAGNIGRGFVGQLFTQSGYEVVFVDINSEIVNSLNINRAYKLYVVCDDFKKEITIRNVRAINFSEKDRIIKEFEDAEISATAVGVISFPEIIPVIGEGIRRRFDRKIKIPLNIIICENMLDSSKVMKESVLNYLGENYSSYVEENIGFIETVVSRMIPPVPEEIKKVDNTAIFAEPYDILPVAKSGFKGDIPLIKGMVPYENLKIYEEQKLFIHNLGHAITAYLGYLKKREFIYQAISDTEIYTVVRKALDESARALNLKYSISMKEQNQYINDLLKRFSNRALPDTVYRVGREPVRKLKPNDRFIGSAKMCFQYQIKPENIALGTAACLSYDYKGDSQAVELSVMIKNKGVKRVLKEISNIDESHEFSEMVLKRYNQLKNQFN